jgi:hypothetical protein
MNQGNHLNLKNDGYLALTLLLAILNMAAIFVFFGFQVYDDTPSYIDAIHFFQGKEVILHPWRLMAPLGPILALPFEFLGPGAGLIAQNIIFYILSVYLVFKIMDMITGQKKQAFWGSIFFMAALPMIFFGLSYLTDIGAWFFYLI